MNILSEEKITVVTIEYNLREDTGGRQEVFRYLDGLYGSMNYQVSRSGPAFGKEGIGRIVAHVSQEAFEKGAGRVSEDQIEALEGLIVRLRRVAVAVGPIHAYWDIIADIKATLGRRSNVLDKTAAEMIEYAKKKLRDKGG